MPNRTNSSSQRERWIKAILPAAAIAAVYMLGYTLTLNRRLGSLQEDLEVAEAAAVTDDEVARVFTDRNAAEKRIKALRAQIDETDEQIRKSVARLVGVNQTSRLVQIDQLCRRHSIGVVNQKTTASVALSAVREQSLDTLRKVSEQKALTYRQFEMVANYMSMTMFLQCLPQEIDGVIPLGIELLETKPDSKPLAPGQRIWRVFLLM
tara:strand:- start:68 stop:691 length:624 start_codon:yes stop_codon:yes gene_type:complete